MKNQISYNDQRIMLYGNKDFYDNAFKQVEKLLTPLFEKMSFKLTDDQKKRSVEMMMQFADFDSNWNLIR